MEDVRTHTHTHTAVGLRRRGIGPSQPPLPDNTQHSQQTDINAPGGIRTRNPSKRADADPRFRPRGYRDRLKFFLQYLLRDICGIHQDSESVRYLLG